MKSINLGVVTAVVVILIALVALMIQGDPCDSAAHPQQCRAELPDR